MFAYLIMGAMKEILSQAVRLDGAFSETEVVDAIYEFLGQGCLRIAHDPRK